jgi:hypothetical protein
VSEPEFPLMATLATGAWLAPGNRVEAMLNGDRGLEDRAIGDAGRNLGAYIVRPEEGSLT